VAPDEKEGPQDSDPGGTNHHNDPHHHDQVTSDLSRVGRLGGALTAQKAATLRGGVE
jgi:hypothetical protein